MKRALLAAALAVGLSGAAEAACPAAFGVMKDNAGSTFNMALVNDPTGSNCQSNVAATIAGTLPAFASTPTVNLGTIGGVATQTTLASVLTALGSPFQAGGSIANTSFGATQATASLLNATVVGPTADGTAAATNPLLIAGTVDGTGTGAVAIPRISSGGLVSVDGSAVTQPISASSLPLPTGAATQTTLASILSALGSPFQAGGSIGNTSFAATQATASALNATVVGTGTFAVQATLQASATTAIGKVDPNTPANWGIGTSTQNSASIANGHLILGQFNTAPTTISTGNMSPLQMDNAGNLLVNIKAGASSGAVAQGSTTSGQTGGLTQCAVTTSAPTYTTATTNPLSCDTSGNQRVTVANTNANGSAVSASSSPVVIASDQAAVATKAASGAFVAGSIADLAHGSAVSAASVPVVIASDQGAVATKAASAAFASGALVDVTNMSGATGSAVPSKALYNGAVSSGNLVGLIQADASAAINVSTATTTQLVALTSGQRILVTSLDVLAGGTGNITFEYGTGTACATGTTVLTGAYNLTAQAGLSKGGGLGPVLVVPSGNALCVLTSAAVQMSGSVAYTKTP